ncbi:conserved exported hypothetical protein [Paraburkholderia piptadeniae]|uniref:Alginate regulatory protein AlgP n=1 Tax=Paraburkholderia piptadeniae TaxID=1701573 RepID=A0A1N7S7R4_9BURK|nr:hypothetical protein [Paraburkholderia piptadeniae]SIT43063.1 conserved exported hypothetical protein [Paraburkholderia piptadeniae]
MSFGFRVGVAVGLLCASMAARAEYKEVWNPPEAAPGARHVAHSKHPAPVGSGAAAGAHRHAAAPRANVAAAKPGTKAHAKKAASVAAGTAVKTAHVSGSHVPPHQAQAAHAKPAVAVVTPKSAQAANVPAPQASGGGAMPRELPPILK